MREFWTFETRLVRLTRKSDESLVVDVNFERINASHEHIKSNIKFETIEKQGIRDVFADNVLFTSRRELRKIC